MNEPFSVDENVARQETEPPVFYICSCPDCGDELEIVDTGIFQCSPVLGITSEGELGSINTSLDGASEISLLCSGCGKRICSDFGPEETCDENFLLHWARSNGEALVTLPFNCPECGGHTLYEIEIGVEWHEQVLAVCEADLEDGGPVVAVSHDRSIENPLTPRYRCSCQYELIKEDGSPVKTRKELVEWLKAHQASSKE